MINIFNLFLTLFFFWLSFAYLGENLSWLCVFFGLLSSLIISFIAWKIKIINKYSHLIFLHFGFYKHFVGLIFSAFPQSLLTAYRAAIASQKINPKIHFFLVKSLNNNELVLLISTINMMPHLLFIGVKDKLKGKEVIILSLNDFSVSKLNLRQVISDLDKINDNRLV